MTLDTIKHTPMTTILDAANIPHKRAKAICPFHHDRHPSLALKRNFYTCFSCGAKGDSIKFVREYYELGFVDAVKWIARATGVSCEGFEVDTRAYKRKESLREVLNESYTELLAMLNGEFEVLFDRYWTQNVIERRCWGARFFTFELYYFERCDEIDECLRKLEDARYNFKS